MCVCVQCPLCSDDHKPNDFGPPVLCACVLQATDGLLPNNSNTMPATLLNLRITSLAALCHLSLVLCFLAPTVQLPTTASHPPDI